MKTLLASVGGWAALAALLFLLLGLPFVPLAGVQCDEALFSGPMFDADLSHFRMPVFHRQVPLMLMSYLGTLKTALYVPILKAFGPGVYSIRLPMLMAGAATVGLFVLLLSRLAGWRAALAGGLLLATDAVFLLTTVYDWGPVALQHLFLVSGGLALARGGFFAGFLLLGLGLWDKALFLWLMVASVAGVLAAWPGVLLRSLTWGRVAAAVLGFSIGAAPLLIFNARSGLETFRGNTKFSAADLPGKARMLVRTLDGYALFGYVVGEGNDGIAAPPRNVFERASVRVAEAAGRPRRGLGAWALAASVLLLPLLWKSPERRALVFGTVFVAVGWLQMALVEGAGGSAHHSILLWPAPQLCVASALAGLSGLPAGRQGSRLYAGLLAALVLSNLLVLNQNHAQLVRYGGAGSWSEAIFPLSERLRGAGAREIWILDWGMIDNLRLLEMHRLPLRNGMELLGTPDRFPAAASNPEALFVSYVDGREEFAGTNAKTASLAAAAGLERRPEGIVRDRAGRPVFQLFRFAPRATP